jgi:1,4-dihydroxy-2-naphthoate octaprenyltransferase
VSPAHASEARLWLLAARPRTLPAALAPVLVGCALARAAGVFRPLPALLALSVSLLLQIGVNLANDYFDGLRGVDGPDRLGPLRVTQAGLIAPHRVRRAMAGVLLAAGAAGLWLVGLAGWPVFWAGAAALLAALAYSGGPWPLASHGLGDLCVLIFFGPVAVCGTYYVQALRLDAAVLAGSLPVGLLIAAILTVNNLRDIASDRRAGKRTLAVRLGLAGTRVEHLLLTTAAYLVPAPGLPLGPEQAWNWLPLLSLPLALATVRQLFSAGSGPQYNRLLGRSALLALLFGLLQALALVLPR